MKTLKSLLPSILTEHFLAKVFAIIFATVTVYLIDRDIASVEVWESKRVAVLLARDDRGSEKNVIRILIEADPSVWIGDFPRELKVRISGPKNREAEFRNDPIIRVHVSQEQVPTDFTPATAPTIRLVAEDFTSKISGLIVEPLEEFEIKVDEITEADKVPLTLGTRLQVPRSRSIDRARSRIIPPTARVFGPRHQLEALRNGGSLSVVPEDQGVLEGGRTYPVVVEDETLSLELNPNQDPPNLHLEVKNAESDSINLGVLPIYWALSEEVRAQMVKGEIELKRALSFQEVSVHVVGPEDVLNRYREEGDGVARLSSLIRIVADPNRQIRENLVGSNEVMIDLLAIGVPPGLKAEISPSLIRVTITRKNTDNK